MFQYVYLYMVILEFSLNSLFVFSEIKYLYYYFFLYLTYKILFLVFIKCCDFVIIIVFFFFLILLNTIKVNSLMFIFTLLNFNYLLIFCIFWCIVMFIESFILSTNFNFLFSQFFIFLFSYVFIFITNSIILF